MRGGWLPILLVLFAGGPALAESYLYAAAGTPEAIPGLGLVGWLLLVLVLAGSASYWIYPKRLRVRR